MPGGAGCVFFESIFKQRFVGIIAEVLLREGVLCLIKTGGGVLVLGCVGVFLSMA